jgi:transposase
VRLEERVAELETIVARLRQTVAELQEELLKKDRTISAQAERIRELEAALEESRRAGKRQASPFSKGEPKPDPKRPGRKSGEAHGRHGHRMAPAGPADRELDAPLPACCPDCGGEVEHKRDAEQWQVDVGEPQVVKTRFWVAVGHCRKCGKRVQGRHPEQTSDALGAAGSQVGPTAKAWASFLHYNLGLSWAKVSRLLTRLGVPATAGALCRASVRQACTDLVPVHQELVQVANSSPVLVMDETGWRINGEHAWLWEATNAVVTLYWVARGLAPEERVKAAAELAERLEALCQAETGHEEVRKFLAHLEREGPAKFTFLYDERVDATNWRAEQGIRPAVVNRKVWGGNRTDRGGRAQSVMTSVIRTAAQHGVDAIDYLAARARSPDPGLAILLG